MRQRQFVQIHQWLSYLLVLAGLLVVVTPGRSIAQSEPRDRSSIRVSPVTRYVPGHWSLLSVSASNVGDAKTVKAVAWFDTAPQLQFAREFHVPADSVRVTSVPVLIPEKPNANGELELKWAFIEQAGEGEVFGGDYAFNGNKIEGQPLHVPIRPRQTAVIFDTNDQSLDVLEHVRRQLPSLFDNSSIYIHQGTSAPESDAGFDPADLVVLLSDDITRSSNSVQSLRSWVRRGGTLWLPVNVLDSETIVQIVEDAFPFTIVDRTKLTRFDLIRTQFSEHQSKSFSAVLDKGVDFIQLVSDESAVTHRIDGWPAAIRQSIGRGHVVLTTLGIEGWVTPPNWSSDSNALPVNDYVSTTLTRELSALLTKSHTDAGRQLVSVDAQLEYLQHQIGYKAPSRRLVGIVSIVYCVLLAVMGVILLRRGRAGQMLAGVPILVLMTSGLFVVAGRAGKSADHKAVSLEVVETQPGQDDIISDGTLLLYSTNSATTKISGSHGVTVAPSSRNASSSIARMTWTDSSEWHFDNLKVPPGTVQFDIRQAWRPSMPIEARGSFDSNGFFGTVLGLPEMAGASVRLADAIIAGPTHSSLAVSVQADGRLVADKELPTGEFLAAAMLSEEQARRQAVYRDALDPRILERRLFKRPTLFAWSQSIEEKFQIDGLTSDSAGGRFYAIDLELQRPTSGTAIRIPAPFLPYRTVTGGKGRGIVSAFKNSTGVWSDSNNVASATLRFQLPESLLPLVAEEVLFTIRISAPARGVEILAGVPGAFKVIDQHESPIGTFEFSVRDPDLLQIDKDGGLFMGVDIGGINIASDPEDFGTQDRNWKIEWVQIEFTGSTL